MSGLANVLPQLQGKVFQLKQSSPNNSAKDKQLDQFRVRDAEPGNITTTNFGVRVSHDDDSLKAGIRGPTLIEDFHFREKITHFDHERIPERVVHARGSAAHGYFQVYESQSDVTTAGFLNDPSRKTPVFVRFSTVLGSRGSADTVRDVRGFATRFYTDEGNFDLVGNNIPVFFIQDAIKFPDIIHAGKPEAHNEIPQAQTAHDNFWDFISLTPESTHMAMWALSDRAIPRSFRMMQGFGVNTYVLVNDKNERSFVKFHWRPLLGTHSLVWDEAQKLAGQDPDFHRRDLWEAIESGLYPEYEFGLQIVNEKDENNFDFDILDATKIIPEELVPVRWVGKMVLDRNPTEFFSEVEQVAFCVQHLVPGIDFSNDPLLQGRAFSYLDTQLTRLGGPNFMEIPINRPMCPVFNNQRDGFMRQSIHTSKVNYWPNRMHAPRPGKAEENAYVNYAEKIAGIKTRTRAPKFQEHFSQATLFWNSLSNVERDHLVGAAQFELGKCDDEGVRQRVVNLFNNVDHEFAKRVTVGIGIEPPAAPIRENHGQSSPALSMQNTVKSIATRKIAFLITDGYDASQLLEARTGLKAAGAVTYIIGPRKGPIKSSVELSMGEGVAEDNSGDVDPSQKTVIGLFADFTFWTAKSTLFDAIVVPGGELSIKTLSGIGEARYFVNEAFKHYKPIGAIGEGILFLQTATHISGVKMASIDDGEDIVSDNGVVTLWNYSKLASGVGAGGTTGIGLGAASGNPLVALAGGVTGTVAGALTSGMNGGVGGFTNEFVNAVAQHRWWNRDTLSIPV